MKPSDTVLLNHRTAKPLAMTRMGFGSAPLGNLYRRVSDEDAEAAILAAHAAGIRYIDTAPQYGLGRAEERIGRTLPKIGRDGLVISTKIGRLLEDCAPDEVTPYAFVDVPQKRLVFDYSYDAVMRSHEESLKRLGVDRVDILLVHDVCVFSQGSRAMSDQRVRELFDLGGYRAISELKASGAVTAIGAGVNEWEVCETLLGLADFDCFLLAGRYTLLEQEALTSFLPLCEKRDVGIILGGVYNSGILATGAIEGAKYNYDTAPPEILDRVRRIEQVAAAHRVPLAASALQFVYAHPAVKTVIPGMTSAAEMEANARLLSTEIPAAFWSDLKTEGLIRADAPTP
jgi:D-threo-aldose 1-dehydrogenase